MVSPVKTPEVPGISLPGWEGYHLVVSHLDNLQAGALARGAKR